MTENIILEKQIIEKAKIVSCKIHDEKLRKRAFVLNIAANAVADFLNKSGLKIDTKLSLYRVASFAQNLELADIYFAGKRLDVRVTVDGEVFGVPKIHEKYEATPCAYLVLKLDKNLQNASLLGFVASKDLPKVKSDTEYFEYGTSILQPIIELADFLEKEDNEHKIFPVAEHEKIKELSLAFIDDEISESEKVFFIKHVVSCPVCREVFCDVNDFDVVAGDVKVYPELLNDSTLSVLAGNKQELDLAALADMAVLGDEVENNDEVSEDSLTIDEEIVVEQNEIDIENEIIEENIQEEFSNETALLELAEVSEEDNTETLEFDEFNENNLNEKEEETIEETPIPVAPVEIFDEISLDSIDDELNFVEEDTESAEEELVSEQEELVVDELVFEEEDASAQEHDLSETKELSLSEKSDEILVEETENFLADEELILPMGAIYDKEEAFAEKENVDVVETEEILFVEDDLESSNEDFVVDDVEETVTQETTSLETDILLIDEEESSFDQVVEEDSTQNIETLETLDFVEQTEENTEKILSEDEDSILLEHEEDLLEISESTQEDNFEVNLVENTETEDNILSEHDDEDIFSLSEEHDDILEEFDEVTEKPSSEPVSQTVKKSYDFSLETEVQEPIEELIGEQPDSVDEENIKNEENKIYPESSQEPVELVYDDEDEIEEEKTEYEETTDDADVSSQEESAIEIQASMESLETEQDSANESEIQQLLDDDLLALLTDDSTESSVDSETTVVDESQDVNNTDVDEQTESTQEGEEPIETLFDDSQTQENGEQKEFELAQEPLSAKTVSATKRLLVLTALLLLIAGGGAGMWFYNNNNSVESFGDGSNQDAEMYDMQNNANEPATPVVSQDINKSMANSFSDKPAAITITKLSWQINEKLAADNSVKEYLQTAGKNIQMNLQNDLVNSTDVNFNNIVKVSMEITQENDLKGIQILESSGSDQVDDIIVRGIKNTLKYVNVPKVKDYSSDYFLTLIINF